ncbi:hypothetical protein FHL15_005717 [Xylaria flabelliformis]|uniref:Uncharacterized protein n=1 Tax=Xylaria flabelliformis TaxID=2512241 RepID=A0A553HZR5_9PEZI|nr:hypothetical protein FHL15_005717 [Xylaria flabelliformis]
MAEDCCFEIFGPFLFDLVWRSIASAEVIITERLFVRRRKFIVRIGRGFQNILHLPRCLCAFTTDDPGITKRALRISSMVMMASFTISDIIASCAFYVDGTRAFKNPLFLGLSVGISLFCGIMVWIVLAIKKQPESSSNSDCNLEKGIQISDIEDGDEAEMDNTIKCIWSLPPCIP